MSMNAALSGLSAAQTDISATSHNIANVGTTGFRRSRTEFSDVYSASPQTVARTTVGSGTQVLQVAQDFSQGNIVTTGNTLDLAIEGQGFFAVRPTQLDDGAPPETVFTRSGAFSLDSNGVIVNGSNQPLLGWPVSADGKALSEVFDQAQPLSLPLSMGETQRTTSMNLELQLPTDPAMLGQQAAVPPTAAFDAADATTWAHRSPVPITSADGTPQDAELYLVRTANPSAASPNTSYEAHLLVDGVERPAAAPATLTFDPAGLPVAGTTPLSFGSGATQIDVDLGASTLGSHPFSVESVSDNGKTPSTLTRVEVDTGGTIWATFGAEARVATGKLLLANFTSPGGLRVLGNASFAASDASGAPQVGSPGTLGFGMLRSGALEKANVDLTEELVNLITAQRNYQASAKAMETSSSMMQTIMNIRS